MSNSKQQVVGARIELNLATANVADKTTMLLNAEHELKLAKQSLLNAEDKILLDNLADPKALGSNDRTREASLRAMTVKERGDLWAMEKQRAEVAHALKLAELEHERCKWAIRILSLAENAEPSKTPWPHTHRPASLNQNETAPERIQK